MTQKPIKGRLSYRLVDPNSGAVVVPELPHLHESTWTVRALQQGLPGSASMGGFSIPIPPASSLEYKRNKQVYDLITNTPGLRVEAFPGDSVTGSPRFSGVATKVLPGFDSWEITGMDSLFWLQQSQLFPGEVLGAGGTLRTIVDNLRSTREVVYDDDFATWSGLGGHTSADYTNSGWSFVAADPLEGQPAITATAAASRAVTLSGWTAAHEYNWQALPASFAASMVTVEGVIFAGTDTSNAGTAEVLFLCDATVQNGYLCRLLMAQTGAGTGLYTVFAEIWSFAAGVFTLQKSTTALTGVPATLPFEVNAVLYSFGTNHIVRCLVNGKDSGCTYSFTTAPVTSGGVGCRFTFTAGGSPSIYVNKLKFESRPVPANWGSARFGAGTLSTGVTLAESIASSAQTHLDMYLLASTLDGFWLRKNAGFGARGDTIDYTAVPGADLTGSVVFEEGVNLDMSGTKVLPVAETFALTARVNGVPGGASGGTFTWSPLQKAGDMVLVDTVSDLGVPGFALLVAYTRLIAQRKASPLQCIELSVLRLGDIVDKWRELDFVTAHIPSYGIIRQRAQIMGYTYTEGSPVQTVWLNQFPDSFAQGPLQRLIRSVDWIGSIVAPR